MVSQTAAAAGSAATLCEDVPRQRGEQIVENLLVLRDPDVVVGVGDLVVGLLRSLGNGLGRNGRRRAEEVRDLGALERREDLSLP